MLGRDRAERIAEVIRVAENNLNAAIQSAHKAGLQVSLEVDEIQELGEYFDMPYVHVRLFAPIK